MPPPSLFATFARGPLAEESRLPLLLPARWCDLRPRFLSKGWMGRGYRAIARNGRVLLAADRPLEELAGQTLLGRLNLWHKAILPGDAPAPYGLLLVVRGDARVSNQPLFDTRLNRPGDAEGQRSQLTLDVGGGLVLEFAAPTS